MARNLRRMKAASGSSLYDFSPNVFILPNDFTRFLAEYNRLRPSVYWICKPVDLSRGRGIFIFKEVKDLVYDGPVIVQRYISNPLLISGYKFDLRIYVCVKSFHPLTVYIHQEGLVRFSTEKYDLSSLGNLYTHLTNTSINKLGPFYRTEKGRVGRGCKWTMSKFRHFLHGQDVNELLLWQKVSNIVTLTLLTIAPSVPSCPNCVELFGFDILIDVKFKPWLLEVNYSPALTLDCQADITVKKRLIGDLIDLMNYTSVDALRDKAYQRHKHKQPRFNAGLLSQVKETKCKRKTKCNLSSESLSLSLLTAAPQSDEINPRRAAHNRRRLPPVDLRKTFVHSGKTTNEKSLNLILGPHSRTNVSVVNRRTCPALAPWLMDNRSLHVSEVTKRDDTETEAELELSGETDVSSKIPDIPPSRTGDRRPAAAAAASWRLPNIYRCVHHSSVSCAFLKCGRF